MKDREFINNLIKVYFSNAKEPHQATLDNAITNRLNDIVDKLEEQEKENAECKRVLEIIDEKNVDILDIRMSKTVDNYNFAISSSNLNRKELTQEEFDTLKRWVENDEKY